MQLEQNQPTNNHKPNKNAVPSAFSPVNRWMFTWDVGSPFKARDLDQDFPSCQGKWSDCLPIGYYRGDPNLSCQTMPSISISYSFCQRQPPFPSSTILEVFPWDMEYKGTFSNNYAKWKSCNLKWVKSIFSQWKLKTVEHFHSIITRFLGKYEWIEFHTSYSLWSCWRSQLQCLHRIF